METGNKNNSGTIREKFSEVINKTRQEVEELALQFSLGKAEASDKFEEIKKEFNSRIQEWKLSIKDEDSELNQSIHKLKAGVDELQLQLKLGKAEAKDFFEKQRTGIIQAMDNLENELRSHPRWNSLLSDFKNEGDKLRLKLEILQLKFELKKFRITDDFKSMMSQVQTEASKVLEKAEEKWDNTRSKYTDFNDEMSLVYKHLKKAIKSL